MRVSGELKRRRRPAPHSGTNWSEFTGTTHINKVKRKELLGSGEAEYLGFIVHKPASLFVASGISSDLLMLSFSVLLQPSIILLFLDILTALSKHLLCQPSLLA
ncbi:hypothetical protein QQP08_008754, partial [Theobroma cacao]